MLLLREAEHFDEIVTFMTSDNLSVRHTSGATLSVQSTDVLFDSLLVEKPYAITGGKTGYIPEAGYCFITTVDHDGDEVFVAVLGARSKLDRFNDAKALAVWAFNTFTWPQL